VPIYTTATTGVGTTGAGQGATRANGVTGFSNTAVSRIPRYTTNLGEGIPYVAHPAPQMQAELQGIIARSSLLKNKGQIRVAVEGDVVVLSGQVGSESESRLAANVLRTVNGIGMIDNQLVFPGRP
jgi:hypothetical protein